jgi:hypothetical protein
MGSTILPLALMSFDDTTVEKPLMMLWLER